MAHMRSRAGLINPQSALPLAENKAPDRTSAIYQTRPGGRARRAGGALLAVLWLSAALSAIAFSLANSVRGETERTATVVEGLRGYYLATGAIERALLHMEWGQPYYTPGTPRLMLQFPSGEAEVEVIPETAKMNLNLAPQEDLFRLLAALGVEPEHAGEIVLAIVDWRTPNPSGGPTPFDQYYLSLIPSFRSRHASFEEIEELLLVRGMTPDLFYGSYERDREGRLAPRAGLRDCLSVYGGAGSFDINTAEPAVLAAIGLSPEMVSAIVEARRRMPFTPEGLAAFAQGGPALARLGIGGGPIFTLRATARVRLGNGALSGQTRSVAALVKFGGNSGKPYQMLRWYDSVWVQ